MAHGTEDTVMQPADPDTLSIIGHAVQLNNAGSFFLSTGDEVRAFQAYKKALDALHGVTSEDAFEQVENSDLESSDDNQSSQDAEPQPQAPTIAMPYVCPLPTGSNKFVLEDAGYFIYDKPFIFKPACQLESFCTPLYIALVIFNMALLLHKKALNSDEAPLVKAMRLYDMCLLLLRSVPKCQLARHDCSDLVLVALNNKIHLHFCMHQPDVADTELEELSVLLYSAFEGLTELDEAGLSSMVLNTVLPSNPRQVAPAA